MAGFDDTTIRPLNRPWLTRWAWAIVLVSGVAGLAIRIVVMITPPSGAYVWDQHEYVQWGVKMLRDGLTSVHTSRPPDIRAYNPSRGEVVNAVRDDMRSCNYPPLAMYVIYAQTRLYAALTDEIVSNTPLARAIYSSPAVLADLLLAAGCLAIAIRFASPRVAAIAFAAVALGPPFIIDSAQWGQTDAWVLAPMVWSLWAMLGRRWTLAGVLWGIALGLKTQGVLLVVVWAAAILIYRQRRIVLAALIGPIILFAAGLPFTIGSGWAWFQRSILDNLFHSFPYTTLKAFNLWYLDLLISENDDSLQTLAGLSKDVCGKLLFAAAVVGLLVWAVRSRRNRESRLLVFATGFLLAAVILPTRVHERYILLPLPFLIAATAFRVRLWWPLVPFIVAATFQISAFQWLHMGAQTWGYQVESVHEEYAQLAERLSADELARYPRPDVVLERMRPGFVRRRWETGDPIREWLLTLLELISAGGCMFVLLQARSTSNTHRRAQHALNP